MNINLTFAFFACLLTSFLGAQSQTIATALNEIEQNNEDLKAYYSHIESRKLDLKSMNNLANPQFSAFYLPFGVHNTAQYSEFQLSQSFEFPTVYAARNKWLAEKTQQLNLQYEQLRQDILLASKKFCLELISLTKRRKLEEQRVLQARQLMEQARDLYEKEQAGILELNRAKLVWLQDQFQVEQIENEIKNVKLSLQKLNGGKPLLFEQTEYQESLAVAPHDSIWQQVKINDPAINTLNKTEQVALQQVQVQKSKWFPNITAGVNYQGVLGSNYYGVYGGMSIPLWKGKNKVKAARAQYQFQQVNTKVVINERYTGFLQQYNTYDLMLRKFREYTATLKSLTSEKLLLEAYQLGQISFMDYYEELQFYRQAYNKMLEVEKNLHQLKTELLKHQL